VKEGGYRDVSLIRSCAEASRAHTATQMTRWGAPYDPSPLGGRGYERLSFQRAQAPPLALVWTIGEPLGAGNGIFTAPLVRSGTLRPRDVQIRIYTSELERGRRGRSAKE
jgi:hypothetical protein